MTLNKEYIKNKLLNSGLKAGDSVLVHSQLLKVGLPEEDIFDLGKYYLDIILDIIGDAGELILPAFTYSYCKKKEFRPKKDLSTVSELANTCIRNHIGYRTCDPIFSYVVVNPKNTQIQFSNICFDFENGMAGYLSKKNAKYLMIGDQIYFTLLHACEQQLKTENRFMKKFFGITSIDDQKIENAFYFYCRRNCENTIGDAQKLQQIVFDPLIKEKKIAQKEFGNTQIFLCSNLNIVMDAYRNSFKRDLFELLVGPGLTVEELKKIDPETEETDIKIENYGLIKL